MVVRIVGGDRRHSVGAASTAAGSSPAERSGSSIRSRPVRRQRRYRFTVVRVHLLGAAVVERDGRAVTVSGAARRLLVFLALDPGPHDRAALANQLWPELPAATARANLRNALWELRKAVGEDVVLASRVVAGLRAALLWVDVAEVGRLAERGELASAAELCRGELAPELGDDWVLAAREQHRERQVMLLDRLAEQCEAGGDTAAAARWSRRRHALTPLDEPGLCLLLDRLAATGDRAGAALAGRQFVDRLRDELDVAPSPATRSALARLHAAVPAPLAATPDTARRPMFGRARELGTLTAAWSLARRGQGRVCVVTGEAGIGKTRLIGALADRADNVGARVAIGAGADVGAEAPLAIWHALVRELVHDVPAPPRQAAWPGELARLAPDLAGALGRTGTPPSLAAPELERLRIFDAVLRLIEWSVADRPVLLVAEDVHRADRASMQLCAHIGRRTVGLPLLFVLTRRDRPARPDADVLCADLIGRGVEVEQVVLEPLNPPEMAAAARTVTALTDQDVDRVVATADGNPLLAVESARALAAGSTAVPTNLRAVVRAATGSVPPPGRALVETLAAAGRDLSGAEIESLALPGRREAESHALETGLLRRQRGGLGFRHALLAEAVRVELRDPEHHHRQAALAIERAAGARRDQVAAEVAGHLHSAGRDDLAGSRWERAAHHARSLGALPEAATFWGEAVRCDPTAVEARLELAEVLGWLGRPEDFEREWRAALDLLPLSAQSRAWSRRGKVLRTVVCHPSESLRAYRRAAELLGPNAPASLRCDVLIGMAIGEASAGSPERAEALLDEVETLVTDRDPGTLGEIGTARLLTQIRLGRLGRCEHIADSAGAAATRAGRPDIAYPIWVHAACALTCAGDLPAALRAADQALAATRGITVIEVPCLAVRALLLSRLGRHDEALAASAEQLTLAARIETPEPAGLAHHDAGLVALAAGHHRDAATHLEVALDADARISRPATRLARAEALAGSGDPHEATAELRRAALEPVGPADQPWALVPRMARVQGLIALARGDLAEARRRLTEAADSWQRCAAPAPGGELMVNFVDLGRPVVGLVEPGRELARLRAELAEINTLTEVP